MTDTQTAQAHDEAVEADIDGARIYASHRAMRFYQDAWDKPTKIWRDVVMEYEAAMAERGFTMQPVGTAAYTQDQIDKAAGVRVSVPTTNTKGTGG